MTRTTTRTASAAYIRTIRDRLQLADDHAQYAAIRDDIDTMLASPGATLLTDSQLRNLQRMRERADANADPLRAPEAGATHDLRPSAPTPAAPPPAAKPAPTKPKPTPKPAAKNPEPKPRPKPKPRRRRRRPQRWNPIIRACLEPLFALGLAGASIAILAMTLQHIAPH